MIECDGHPHSSGTFTKGILTMKAAKYDLEHLLKGVKNSEFCMSFILAMHINTKKIFF